MIKRLKKTLTVIPASILEAASFLRSIAEKQKEINAEKSAAKKAKDEYAKKIAGLKKDRDAFFVALFAFAAPRKAELTKDKRSVQTDAGTFGWRWTTPTVELAEGKSDQDVIATLKRVGLTKYIRVIEELDREALRVDQPAITGVSYIQQDEFFAKPKMGKGQGRSEELVKITEATDI
jgi:phage host-nuclease inhibitor protein Gam